MRRARTSIAGSLIAALAVIATQAPIIAHEAAHWTVPAQEHRHDDEIHLHRHDAHHDHDAYLQQELLSIAPAGSLYRPEARFLPLIGLTAGPIPFIGGRVPNRSWSVRGPPPPLALSFPPAYSTAPPAV